jgi:glutathione synthase/RimK-type ligase-like ATP-grasp enzyme
MPNSERIFVASIKKYCAARDIAVDVRSDGWLIVMQRGPRRHFAFGYDVGLNSAIAHRIANDKAATAEVLQLSGIACVPHHLFLSPALRKPGSPTSEREQMRGMLKKYPQGIVLKPNEGTSGRSIFLVRDEAGLEHAVKEIFSAYLGLAISPHVEIEDEIRVILLDDAALAVYSKERGNDWRHNLEFGARPLLLEQGEARDASVAIAIGAARAIGIRFASIDVVCVGGSWQVLEINSGVMMEALSRFYPDLVYAIYDAALDKLFNSS